MVGLLQRQRRHEEHTMEVPGTRPQRDVRRHVALAGMGVFIERGRLGLGNGWTRRRRRFDHLLGEQHHPPLRETRMSRHGLLRERLGRRMWYDRVGVWMRRGRHRGVLRGRGQSSLHGVRHPRPRHWHALHGLRSSRDGRLRLDGDSSAASSSEAGWDGYEASR